MMIQQLRDANATAALDDRVTITVDREAIELGIYSNEGIKVNLPLSHSLWPKRPYMGQAWQSTNRAARLLPLVAVVVVADADCGILIGIYFNSYIVPIDTEIVFIFSSSTKIYITCRLTSFPGRHHRVFVSGSYIGSPEMEATFRILMAYIFIQMKPWSLLSLTTQSQSFGVVRSSVRWSNCGAHFIFIFTVPPPRTPTTCHHHHLLQPFSKCSGCENHGGIYKFGHQSLNAQDGHAVFCLRISFNMHNWSI